ncbi:MAG: hypothetical protein HZA91_12360 [Verrucomicrobia bacterium]|nr:hypothetical protein [Verrucomicrobiota bacterium]
MDIFDLVWNVQQQAKLGELETEVHFAKGDAQAAAQSVLMNIVVPLEQRVDRLALVTRAMWALIRENTQLTETDLVKRITEIDAMDGAVDGKVLKPPMQCPKCDSMVCRQFRRCLFCGYEDETANPFDAV